MLKIFLYPFSWLYGLIVFFRNQLYDLNVLKSRDFDIPVISIGNITVGGTGKTPHVEYLIELLKDNFSVATLSRGYKRKTKGFKWVEVQSKVGEVGDEPLQVKKKFTDIKVAVCENRVSGAEKIFSEKKESTPDVLLLDDAFQHRRIVAGINILLIDYNRPIKEDALLPVGRLRESASQMRRANIIIFTKCPGEITPIMRRVMQKEVKLKPYQELFFTTLEYSNLLPVFTGKEISSEVLKEIKPEILVVTGIAWPSLIYTHLEKFSSRLDKMRFPDHHNYSEKDLTLILSRFEELKNGNKIIVTTEKDAVRFRDLADLSEQIQNVLYYLPVKVKFLDEEGKLFNKRILGYVGENKSNRELYQRTNKSNS
jgi:tetraacyldisaccharide 4'-kinase